MDPLVFPKLARRLGRSWQRRLRNDRRLPVTALLVFVGLAIFVLSIGYTVVWRERTNDVRIRASRAREDVDTLQALVLQANADFCAALAALARDRSHGPLLA